MGRMNFSQIDIIEVLQKDPQADFYNVFTLRPFRKGQWISSSDTEEDRVFIVKQGQIRVFLLFEGREFTLTYLQPGDIFTSHTQTQIQAETDGELWLCPTAQFRGYLMRCPEFGMRIVSVLGGMLSSSFQIIESLVFASVEQRLAQILVHLAEQQGWQETPDVILRLGMTMDSLAALVNTRRQTASSLMSQLERNGILQKLGRGCYRITDGHALTQLAAGHPEVLKAAAREFGPLLK